VEWISSNFQRFGSAGQESGDELFSGLGALHVETVEDALALWEVHELRPLLAAKLDVSQEYLAQRMELWRGKLSLSMAGMLEPLTDNALHELVFGLDEPEDIKNLLERSSHLDSFQTTYQADLGVSEVNHVPLLQDVRNQGGRGTCVAFGTVALREFLLKSKDLRLSEQYLYWGAKQRDRNPDQSGTQIRHAISCLEEEGVCLDSSWEYNPICEKSEDQGPPPQIPVQELEKFKILEGVQITANSVDSLRAVLSGQGDQPGRVVSIGVAVFNSWCRNPLTYRTGKFTMPLPGEKHVGGHCMCLVGYKDDESWPGGGYFIVRNSWGENWASECPYGAGHGLIPYAYIAKYAWEAWTAKATPLKWSLPIKLPRGTMPIVTLLTALILFSALIYNVLPVVQQNIGSIFNESATELEVDRVQYGKNAVGLDDNEILAAMYARKPGTEQGVFLVDVSNDKNAIPFVAAESGLFQARIILKKEFRQSGIDKVMVLTELMDIPSKQCRACAPVIGGAVLAESKGGLVFESSIPYLARYGNWGTAPATSVVEIGPDSFGVMLETSNLSQGQISRYYKLLLLDLHGGKMLASLGESEDYDNDGDVDIQYRFVPVKGQKYHDLEFIVNKKGRQSKHRMVKLSEQTLR
jgi:C1A family cysteine protease